MGRRTARAAAHPARACCPGRALELPAATAVARCSAAASPDRAASPATSRRRCSARPASTPGMAKNTYGTGCFMLMNTGRAARSANRLLTTIAWQHDERALRAGRRGVRRRRRGAVAARRARHHRALGRRRSAGGQRARHRRRVFRPRLHRTGRPHWDAYARGTIVGLTRGTTRAHIARAALEAIAFQSAEVLVAMQTDAASRCVELRVDGGATANDLLMQFQADLLGVPVVRPQVTETTALGAAYLAGLAAPASGRRRTRSQRTGTSTGDSSRGCRATRPAPAWRAGARPSNARAAGMSRSRIDAWARPSHSRRRCSSC